MLHDDQHPLQVMEGWGQGGEYQFVVKYSKTGTDHRYDKKKQVTAQQCSDRTNNRRSNKKTHTLKTNKFMPHCEEQSGPVFCRTIHINIYSDTVYDTESNDSEQDISEEEDYIKDSSMSISEEDDVSHDGERCVIIESFFT